MESQAEGLMEAPSLPVERVESACPHGWRSGKFIPSLCLWAGMIVGVASATLAGLIGFLPSGHQFNDPILLALSIGTLLRGFLYFSYVNFALTVVYSLLLGVSSWWVLRLLGKRHGLRVLPDEVGRAARSAALISVVPVLIQEIDAVQVLLYYGMATWLSMLIASFTARRLARIRN